MHSWFEVSHALLMVGKRWGIPTTPFLMWGIESTVYDYVSAMQKVVLILSFSCNLWGVYLEEQFVGDDNFILLEVVESHNQLVFGWFYFTKGMFCWMKKKNFSKNQDIGIWLPKK